MKHISFLLKKQMVVKISILVHVVIQKIMSILKCSRTATLLETVLQYGMHPTVRANMVN